ncbi:MAG: hypothetical protein AVDCRST_MAG35-2422 [uncultured Quadrisphaera sp.]|uniref:Uncharacterized protein n=1 Tax=uncultured Quadrisphaera sp. TaxID=904978 RepID=A0A6J4Q1H0_9ACTN|nr:MAG: hypothetical protein AVDCRST_MAG35-2422 [uncultured Quadrisphaera sp.]
MAVPRLRAGVEVRVGPGGLRGESAAVAPRHPGPVRGRRWTSRSGGECGRDSPGVLVPSGGGAPPDPVVTTDRRLRRPPCP